MGKNVTYNGIRIELVYCEEKNPCKNCFFSKNKNFSCSDNCKKGGKYDCQDEFHFIESKKLRKDKLNKIFGE